MGPDVVSWVELLGPQSHSRLYLLPSELVRSIVVECMGLWAESATGLPRHHCLHHWSEVELAASQKEQRHSSSFRQQGIAGALRRVARRVLLALVNAELNTKLPRDQRRQSLSGRKSEAGWVGSGDKRLACSVVNG
jgi:hypothetical protein